MKCANCGSDNPEGLEFCGFCGASMARVQPVAAPAGSPIVQSQSVGGAGIWKIITVLLIVVIVVLNGLWIAVKLSDDSAIDDSNLEIDQLESDIEDANHENAALESEVDSLENELDELQSDYDELEDMYSVLPREIQLYQHLDLESLQADYYQTIREEAGPQSVSWWLYGSTWQEQVEFCADLALHDQGLLYWTGYEDTYHDWYGTYSYDDARDILDFVLDYCGTSVTNTSVEKITEILAFMWDQIEYQPDMIEKFFAPVETLSHGSGDCDDFATLAAALFGAAGIESAIGFFTDPTYTYGHAMTLVKLDDLGPYDYTYYDDLTSMGLSSGTWIVIEPQLLIDNQSAEATGDWYIVAAAES